MTAARRHAAHQAARTVTARDPHRLEPASRSTWCAAAPQASKAPVSPSGAPAKQGPCFVHCTQAICLPQKGQYSPGRTFTAARRQHSAGRFSSSRYSCHWPTVRHSAVQQMHEQTHLQAVLGGGSANGVAAAACVKGVVVHLHVLRAPQHLPGHTGSVRRAANSQLATPAVVNALQAGHYAPIGSARKLEPGLLQQVACRRMQARRAQPHQHLSLRTTVSQLPASRCCWR